MAKQVIDTGSKRTGPSNFGSHASMIDPSETEKVSNKKNLEGQVPEGTETDPFIPPYVVCADQDGKYVTERCRLDDKMADPFRIATKEWRLELLARMTK